MAFDGSTFLRKTTPWSAAGIVAPVLYAATVIVGAAVTPGYSHVQNAISELTAARAAMGGVLSIPFLAYNILALLFARVMWVTLYPLGRLLQASAVALGLVAVLGILMTGFPMDAPGGPVTWRGVIHILLAALESIGSMAAIFFAAFGWRYWSRRRLSAFCFTALAVVFVSGLAAAIAMALSAPISGLLERVTIGAYEIWMAGMAWACLNRATITIQSGR